MKKVKLQPLDQDIGIKTNDTLLQALLEHDMNILQACGAQGRCATCHIYIQAGLDVLSPPTPQEQLTLGFIDTAQANSRLACQTRVLDDGVVVEVPRAMYVGSLGELKALIGQRASQNLYHPYTGEILVEANKLILRSALEKMAQMDQNFETNLGGMLQTND
ncbi:MAG: 2Fe-2S iron-sulfur cluster-binding protein [Cyanobacteria bacterium P01_G01_bin.54]